MIIVGLGNPGEEYADTIHNMGYAVVDKIAEKLNKKLKKIECSSLTSIIKNKPKTILAKPITYMNRSGDAVKSLLSKYGKEQEVIIVYDDIDIDRFSVRVRKNGSAGTHNGMKDVVDKIGTTDFLRIRIGVGKPEHDNLIDYVLSKIPQLDREKFDATIEKVADLIIKFIEDNDVDKLLREGNVIK